jgi:hypothetical protein
MGSLIIYLAEEQYCQVKIFKSFYIQYLIMVVHLTHCPIFVQVRIL